jgi:hypothetical protein
MKIKTATLLAIIGLALFIIANVLSHHAYKFLMDIGISAFTILGGLNYLGPILILPFFIVLYKNQK